MDQLMTCLASVPTDHLIPSMKDISNGEINTLPLVIKVFIRKEIPFVIEILTAKKRSNNKPVLYFEIKYFL